MIIRHDPSLCDWAVVMGCRQWGTVGRFHVAPIEGDVQDLPDGGFAYRIDGNRLFGNFPSAFAACTWAEMECDGHIYCAEALFAV